MGFEKKEEALLCIQSDINYENFQNKIKKDKCKEQQENASYYLKNNKKEQFGKCQWLATRLWEPF